MMPRATSDKPTTPRSTEWHISASSAHSVSSVNLPYLLDDVRASRTRCAHHKAHRPEQRHSRRRQSPAPTDMRQLVTMMLKIRSQ